MQIGAKPEQPPSEEGATDVTAQDVGDIFFP